MVFRKYRHALYITNVSKGKTGKEHGAELSVFDHGFSQGGRVPPADLPDGWDHSPETDERNWLTKQTELRYYNLCAKLAISAELLSGEV